MVCSPRVFKNGTLHQTGNQKNMAAHSFYAVREGRKPGIYSSWKECKEEVNGFANAIY